MAKDWDHSPVVGWLPAMPGALSSIMSTTETKQMMWDAMKVVLKDSFIAALKQSEWCQINNNVPWSLVKCEQAKLKVGEWKEAVQGKT